MVAITPVDGPFGVEVSGLDLARGADEATMRELVAALHENRFMVIRGQSLDRDQFLAFGRHWGEPIPHVLDHLRMPGYPGMMAIGNTGKTADREEIRNGAAFWHTDQSYEAEPSSATLLYSIKAPEVGGDTLIADMFAAYDELDDYGKAGIEDLQVRHLYGAASGRDGETIAAPIINDEQAAKVPVVTHPLVRGHPVTGRKALYSVAGTPCGIEGMDQDAAEALLGKLKAHALQEKFIYRHKYAAGDVVIWDTSATLHSGTKIDAATGESDSRLLWRISVRGRPKVCH
ncbi:MAG: TauD/TfdA family dioxygenase [Alphaproteobacteria bacterium]